MRGNSPFVLLAALGSKVAGSDRVNVNRRDTSEEEKHIRAAILFRETQLRHAHGMAIIPVCDEPERKGWAKVEEGVIRAHDARVLQRPGRFTRELDHEIGLVGDLHRRRKKERGSSPFASLLGY